MSRQWGTPWKVGGFAAGLVAVFAATLAAGRWWGPVAPPAAHADMGAGSHGAGAPRAQVPAGLVVASDGYRLALTPTALSAGERPVAFGFRVLGPDGAPLTRYTATHGKELHLIAVRRDLSGFQHLHPVMAADGTWSVPLRLASAGQWRVFAEFQPAGADAPLTLGVDVPVAGSYAPVPLPAPQRTASAGDGYAVGLAGDLVAGTSSQLTLTVSRNGQPVGDLQPYLAAYGHLVALRDGDLAYLHVHPDGSPGDGRTPPGPAVTFHAEVPSAGAYRLFLDFQHAGVIRTAAFTAVAGPADGAAGAGVGSGGHAEGEGH